MRLSYLDILEQCFHDKFRGYNKQEVDTFLHLVADDFKSMSEEIKEKEILKKKDLDNTIQINIKDEFKSNIPLEQKFQVRQDLKAEDEPHLGDFDDTFTWSAEVLADKVKKLINFLWTILIG